MPIHFDLDVASQATARELDGWFRRLAAEPYGTEAEDELRCILIPGTWRWGQFEEWYEYFHTVAYFPHMWAGLEILPDRPGTETLATLWNLADMPWGARIVAAKLGILDHARSASMTEYDFKRRCNIRGAELRGALSLLAEAGLLKTEIGIAERLQSLKKDELSAVLAARELPKTGTKAKLIDLLVDNLQEAELLALLPPKARQDMIETRPLKLVCGDGAFLDYEDRRLGLLHHTVRFAVGAASNIQELRNCGWPIRALDAGDNCPVCAKYAAGIIDPAAGPFPPFHPGCRCSLVVDPDAEDENRAASSRLADSSTEPEAVSSSAGETAGGCCGCGAGAGILAVALAGIALLSLLWHPI